MANKDRQQNYTNDNKPQDYYEQEYQRQLDEFNRISGAGGQSVQQIDEGVNDFDDYYDAGYPEDHTQGYRSAIRAGKPFIIRSLRLIQRKHSKTADTEQTNVTSTERTEQAERFR